MTLRFRFRRHHEDYADQLAADHDMSPEQARRFRVHNRFADVGLDANRLTAVRWAVEHGRIGEADIAGAVDQVRERVWGDGERGY